MSTRICTTPSENQLIEIKNWLFEEYQKENEGFYINWNIILNYFESNQLIILLKDSDVIGFSTYRFYDDIVVNIDIIEIHPDHRKCGYGNYMMKEVFNFCKIQGAKVASLFCAPKESYKFWENFGFSDFPETGYTQTELSMYMNLVEVRETLKDNYLDKTIIELWDCEPHQSKDVKAKWTWSINTSHNKIEPPILITCDRNWNIRFSIDGEIIKESKVKYFSKMNPIDLDKFMFINELNTHNNK